MARLGVKIRHHGLGPGSWHVYSAMGASPDGDVYSGICDYSLAFKFTDGIGGAHLVRYDPSEDRSYDLGDMQDVTGQRCKERMHPQSKIHTPIVFGSDGRAYFGTHSVERDYVPPEHKDRFTEGYPGGHWVSYDSRHGGFEDLGIAAPGESLMGLATDPEGGKLCATTHKGSFLVEYDIGRRQTRVVGNLGKYPTRTVSYLRDGRAYTFDDRGCLLCYDPMRGSLERLGLKVPNGGFEADLITVFALCSDQKGERLYGLSSLLHGEKLERRGGYLFEYRRTGRGPGEIVDLGNAAVVEGTSTAEADLYHAITWADGLVYYWAPTRGKPVHLIRFDPESGRRSDLGELWAEGSDAHLLAVFAACTGRDGRLYAGGLLKSESDPRWAHEAVLMIIDPEDLPG